MHVVFGGSFDPVHEGHLLTATALREQLQVNRLFLLPAARSPLKSTCTADRHRLAMLRLAIEHYPGLGIDERELRRPPPSYTIDSLREMRCELGNDVSLVWVIGADTLESLALWKNWQQLPELAHLLIVDRPGAHWPTRGAVHEWLRTLPSVQSPNQLQCRPAGLLLRLALPPLPCSSTAIRTALTERRPDSPRPAGLPACVWRYILEHHLYQSDSGHEAQ